MNKKEFDGMMDSFLDCSGKMYRTMVRAILEYGENDETTSGKIVRKKPGMRHYFLTIGQDVIEIKDVCVSGSHLYINCGDYEIKNLDCYPEVCDFITDSLDGNKDWEDYE